MSTEWFSKLKELDSLGRMRINHLKAMSEQEDRLSKLNIRRETHIVQTTKLNQAYLAQQQQLFEVEKKIKVSQEQKQRLIDHGSPEEKITKLLSEMNDLENEGLELLEQQEINEQERKDAKEFISGLDKTIQEISHEVQLENQKHQSEIEIINLRIFSLKEELPEDFKSILNRIESKNLAHGPFTRVENGSCLFCQFKISRVDESEIDMQRQLKICNQCSRIFIPYGT